MDCFDPYAPKKTNGSGTSGNNRDGIHNKVHDQPNQLQSFLKGQRFPSGLQKLLQETHKAQQRRFETTPHHDAANNQSPLSPPDRIWILENTIQMKVTDSHKIGGTFDNLQNVSGTSRWEELRDAVAYQVQAAQLLKLVMTFCLVNDPGANVGPQLMNIGQQQFRNISQELQIIQQVMTKICLDNSTSQMSKHLGHIRALIERYKGQLLQQNKTVTLVLATRGIPTDKEGKYDNGFVKAIQDFAGLPVCFIIRLCTDEEDVIDYFNTLDKYITNVGYDVLDDYFGEALEVYLRNPWLTYGLPLHRFRELGFQSNIPNASNVLDALDETVLTKGQVRDLCSLLFSGNLPDPNLDWNAFMQTLSVLLAKEEEQWNPVTQKKMPWINIAHLNRIYGNNAPNPTDHHYFGSNSQQKQQHPSPHEHQFFTQQQNYQAQQQQYNIRQQQYHTQQQQQQYQQQYQQQQHYQQQQQQQNQQQQQQYQQQQHSYSSGTKPAFNGQTHQDSKTDSSRETVTADELKNKILTLWALQPPQYLKVQPIEHLLSTIQSSLPPAIDGVEPHSHFEKWVPVTKDALMTGPFSVLKRAMRKVQLFLHPDKLPHNFSDMQKRFCKELWDILSDAWNEYKRINNK